MLRIILIIGFVAVSQIAMAFSYTLEITEQELQEKISAMMPMEKKKYFITTIISDPNVDLIKKNDKIGIFSNIEVIAPGGIRGTGRGKIVGTISYDSSKGAFFFHNPTITDLEIDKVPSKFIPKIKKIMQLAATKAMSRYPIYKLKGNNLKQKLAKAVLQSVAVKDGKLLVTLRAF